MAQDKIAIICNYYHRNYGSVLQSYALYKFIELQGGNPHVIGYSPVLNTKQRFEVKFRVGTKLMLNKKYIKKKLCLIFNRDKVKFFLDLRYNKRGKLFDEFVRENIIHIDKYDTLQSLKTSIQNYSAVVLGSDQLWGLSDIIIDYHTLSFVPETQKKIAYGTSFGVSSLPRYFEKKAKNFLLRFDYLSARERSGQTIIKNSIGRNAPLVVDPVLLLNKNEWKKISGNERLIQEKYIFCYMLGNNPQHREIVKRIAKEKGLKIVSISHLDEYVPCDDGFADINADASSPSAFINMIENAELVLTDSFHATVFSIIFKKNFYTFLRYAKNDKLSKNTRITSLLNNLHLGERLIENTEKVDISDKNIDYEEAYIELKELKSKSINYLCKALDMRKKRNNDE